MVVPENHSAMCAARGLGPDLAARAEEHGYSMDICSYARIDLGTVLSEGRGSPSLGLPRPDLLISDNNNCSLLVKWFDVYHREMGVPHFILDVPFCYEPQSEENLQYILGQFKDLIKTLENMTGQQFKEEPVRQALAHSREALTHWKRFLNLAARRPSPITAFDTFAHMAPFFTWMRGTPETTAHFKMLADEAEASGDAGTFPVPQEKYRLLWDNIAPWHQLRKMSAKLAELNANIVCSTYTSCMGSLEGRLDLHAYDDSDPLRFLAREQNMGYCCYGLGLRFQVISEMVEKYAIDGVVFGSNRSCKVYSLLQLW